MDYRDGPDHPTLTESQARLVRGFARMTMQGEIGFADAALALIRADRTACLWASEVEWNAPHHLWTGGPEPRDEDFWTDRLLEAVDAEEAAEAAAEAPATPRAKAASDALQHTLRGFLTDAARFVAIRREWIAKEAAIKETYPTGSRERSAALRAARANMKVRHGRKWNAPGRRLLVRGAAGLGKTEAAASIIAEMREVLGTVHFLTDKRKNASDVVDLIPGSMAVRGRSAPDPQSTDGKAQCWRPDLAEKVAEAGLPVGKTLCRDSAGRTCPFFGHCGYQRDLAAQRSGEATVFAGSHNFIVLRGAMPAADVVVVDESPIPAMIGGVEFGLDRLTPVAMDNWAAAGRLPNAMAHRETMGRIEAAMRDGAGILAGLCARGIRTAADLAEPVAFLRAIEEAEFTGDLTPTMEDAAILVRLARHRSSEVAAVRRMLTALQEEMHLSRSEANGVAFEADRPVTVKDAHGTRRERQARVTVDFRKRLGPADNVPVLILDASGDPDQYRRLFGARLEVEEIAADRNAEVMQVYDTACPTSSLIGIGPDHGGAARASRLRAEIAEAVNTLAAKHGKFFLASGAKVETALKPLLSDDVLTGHFQNLRGSNLYKNCTAGMVVGRNEPPADAMERIGRALYSDHPDPLVTLAKGEDAEARYGTEVRHIIMRDGNRVPVTVAVHPDPRVQRILEVYRERETEQALDRLRLIHCAEPKTVYLLCNIPLGLVVDRVVTIRDFIREMTGRLDNGITGKGRRVYGSRLVEAWRRTGGVLPLVPATLARLFPDLWLTPKAAEKEIEGRNIVAHLEVEAIRQNVAVQISPLLNNIHLEERGLLTREVRFRVEGQHRASRAIVSTEHADPAAALEALIECPVRLAEVPQEAAPAEAAILAPIPPAEPVQQPQESPAMPVVSPAPSFEQRARLARLAVRLEDAIEARSDTGEGPERVPPWMPGPALMWTYRALSLSGQGVVRART